MNIHEKTRSVIVNVNLDEPFSIASDEALNCVVNTPVGEEYVDITDCDAPTRVMNRADVLRLLDEASPHRHGTVREMGAVKAS